MAYSTPARSLMFSKVVAMSQGHLVSSLSQSQSTSATRRKDDSRPLKGNVAKKKRGKLDTKDSSLQKGNTAKKKRGKLDTGYEAAEKRSATTDTKDDAKYDDKEDDLPVGGVPFGVKQRGRGAWLILIQPQSLQRGGARMIPGMRQNTMMMRMFFLSLMRYLERGSGTRGACLSLIQPQLLRRINLNSCRGLFHLNQPMLGRKKHRVLPLRLLMLAGCRVRLTKLCIS
jgi:hypothetical protein